MSLADGTPVAGATQTGKATHPPETRLTRTIDHFKRDWQIYLMLAPMVIWLIVFLYKPMYGLQIAFKDYSIFRGVAGSPWIGFEHFERLFESDQFLRAVRNTVIISFYSLLIGFPVPIILALMFNPMRTRFLAKRCRSSTLLVVP
ncbi:MAG: hypothetical protein AAF366_06910, partial [Pseudomonadota bacterium]